VRFSRSLPWRSRGPAFGPYPGARRRQRAAPDGGAPPSEPVAEGEPFVSVGDDLVVSASASFPAPPAGSMAPPSLAMSDSDLLIAASPSHGLTSGATLALRQTDALARAPESLLVEPADDFGLTRQSA
jgi:hypothetical protein